MDAPPRRRRGSGDNRRRSNGDIPAFGQLILGALLAILGLSAALLFVPGARMHAMRLLSRGSGDLGAVASGSGGNSTSAASGDGIDYAHLTYDAPQKFGSLAARGDLLAYSRTGGLYFVRQGNGIVLSLSPNGQLLHSNVATIDVYAEASGDVPSSHVFMATDPAGDVYLSKTQSRVIEKRDPNGALLQTLKGFDHPEAVAVDESGNLYVVDYDLIKIIRAHAPGAKSSAPTPTVAASGSASAHPAAAPTTAPGAVASATPSATPAKKR